MPTKFRASMLPKDRLTVIRKLAKEYGQVAVIGNGVDDASVRATFSFLLLALAAAAQSLPDLGNMGNLAID